LPGCGEAREHFLIGVLLDCPLPVFGRCGRGQQNGLKGVMNLLPVVLVVLLGGDVTQALIVDPLLDGDGELLLGDIWPLQRYDKVVVSFARSEFVQHDEQRLVTVLARAEIHKTPPSVNTSLPPL
jgi:hypothetical protein